LVSIFTGSGLCVIRNEATRACLDQPSDRDQIDDYTLQSQSKTRLITIMQLIAQLGIITMLDYLNISCHCATQSLLLYTNMARDRKRGEGGESRFRCSSSVLWVCAVCVLVAINCYQKQLWPFLPSLAFTHLLLHPRPTNSHQMGD